MERRKFRDDLHSADERDRLHDVSDVAAEPCFRRETRLAALVASEAHDRSFAIVGCEAVDRREGHADRDRSERPGGRRDDIQLNRVEHQAEWQLPVYNSPETARNVWSGRTPLGYRIDSCVIR